MSAQVERVRRLAAEAAAAAQVRELTTHPDVIALRVERVRAQVDALLWAGIVLGLAFTMVNVQSFAAAGAAPWTAGWLVAWLLDPMVSLVLLAVLRAEQVTARYQVALPAWARRTKWLTFAATYVMNTWTSWGLDSGAGPGEVSWSGVVLHSVPPLVVFATAETGPGLRDRLTEAVHRALIDHHAAGVIPADALHTGVHTANAQHEQHEPDADEADLMASGLLDEHGLSRLWDTAPPAQPAAGRGTPEQRAAALIADGAGRRRLAHELDISEYRARRLLDRARTPDAAQDHGMQPRGDTAEHRQAEHGHDEHEQDEHEQDVDPQRVHAINGAAIGFGPDGAGRDEAGGRTS